MSLFDDTPDQPLLSSKGSRAARGAAPLAERMRPRTLEEYVGQEHLIGAGKPLRGTRLASRIRPPPPVSLSMQSGAHTRAYECPARLRVELHIPDQAMTM